MLTRRSALLGAAQVATLTQLPRIAFANREGNARLVVVILRGALDGLAAVPPYGEPRYATLRGELALDPPGGSDGALKLDGLFALHPRLTSMHRLFAAGELAIAHAIATPYRERSHFDGQDVLENGGTGAGSRRDGWLNRALGQLATGPQDTAIALGQNVPLLLRGTASVASWSPSALPDTADDTLARIADLYANDAQLATRLQEALRARDIAGDDMPGQANDRRGARGQNALGVLTSAAARFLAAPDGPRIAVLEASGWDTHANQGAVQGALAARLAALDAGLGTLERELGPHWQQTAVVILTEFGRTVAVNGTRGTDHGTGTCAFVAGGPVAGGRVISDWPGLAQRDLYQGRDLAPTTDLRAVLKSVLRDHLGVPENVLDQEVFPGSANVAAVDGLIASA